MNRLLQSMFAAGLALGLTACESEKPAPAKTAKADAKPDAQPDAKPGAAAPDAKADPKPDAPGAEDPDDDTAVVDADPDDAGEAADDDLDGYDPRVAKAARIATQISEAPQKADDLLAAADLDRDGLDALMYEIANDPGLTAQYRMARGI